MRRPLVLLGLALILIGSTLALIGPWKETIRVPADLDRELTISDEEVFYVDGDDYTAVSAELGEQSSASGYFRVYYGTLRFFVVDEENFLDWKISGYADEILFEYEDVKDGDFTLEFEEGGEYYFVFDNTGRDKFKRVSFTATARWVELGYAEAINENYAPVYLGIVSAVCGVIIVVVGLRTSMEKRSRYDEIRELWLGKGV